MRRWVWLLFLTLIWLALTNGFYFSNILLGLFVAIAVTYFSKSLVGLSAMRVNFWAVPSFLLFMLKEILVANIKVMVDVMTPTTRSRPAILAYAMMSKTNYQKTWLANMISLTPGSLTLEIDDQKSTLYVHVMFFRSREETLAEIERLEKKLLRVFPL